MPDYLRSAALLFVLLNPFLTIIYLADVIQRLEWPRFLRVVLRASLVAAAVFCFFAVLGDVIFSSVLQAEFASFQIFGGIVFLIVGLQFVFRGQNAIEVLRGDSEHLVGAIAMPVLIGPGTVSASVVIGKRLDPLTACIVVVAVMMTATATMLALKWIHDFVRPRNAQLVHGYLEIAGRVLALYAGTVSVDMIMQGIRTWVQKF
ncbi:MAG: MarC family protein [Planctomycetota bacterium]|nr:MAG: MarC family protein [Planctomycetota bacterium]